MIYEIKRVQLPSPRNIKRGSPCANILVRYTTTWTSALPFGISHGHLSGPCLKTRFPPLDFFLKTRTRGVYTMLHDCTGLSTLRSCVVIITSILPFPKVWFQWKWSIQPFWVYSHSEGFEVSPPCIRAAGHQKAPTNKTISRSGLGHTWRLSPALICYATIKIGMILPAACCFGYTV